MRAVVRRLESGERARWGTPGMETDGRGAWSFNGVGVDGRVLARQWRALAGCHERVQRLRGGLARHARSLLLVSTDGHDARREVSMGKKRRNPKITVEVVVKPEARERQEAAVETLSRFAAGPPRPNLT